MEIYEIDLVRALFANKLDDPTIFLASFYEQIQDQEQITRYVDTIKDLIALQNREKSESDYKAMGIIAQAGDSEILNIKTNYIVPTNYSARFDIELADRDYVLGKIKALINDLRGRKFEVALRANGEIVIFGNPTRFDDIQTLPVITNNIFINYASTNPLGANSATFIAELKRRVSLKQNTLNQDFVVYFIYLNTLYSTIYKHTLFNSVETTEGVYNASLEKSQATVPDINNTTILNLTLGGWLSSAERTDKGVIRIEDVGTGLFYYYRVNLGTETRSEPINLGASSLDNFFKLSISFSGVQSQEPYINNGLDRVYLFFGGNVTITDESVSLGNDIVQTTIQVGKDTGTVYNVEPTEITAGLDMTDDTYPLWSTGYQTIDRNMAISNKISYSFVFDRRLQLFKDFYKFGRYGSGSSTYTQNVFTIKEYRYSFGTLEVDKFYALLGTVNTQNTNGDVMMISATFKVGAY